MRFYIINVITKQVQPKVCTQNRNILFNECNRLNITLIICMSNIITIRFQVAVIHSYIFLVKIPVRIHYYIMMLKTIITFATLFGIFFLFSKNYLL